jgi:hypothetical protein
MNHTIIVVIWLFVIALAAVGTFIITKNADKKCKCGNKCKCDDTGSNFSGKQILND